MINFSSLLERLLYTHGRNGKKAALKNYIKTTPDPDRGFALAALTGNLEIKHLSPKFYRELITEIYDIELFNMSYDYVGDLAETISLLWPTNSKAISKSLSLSEFIALIQKSPRDKQKEIISDFFNLHSQTERWAMIKLTMGGFRVGVSAKLVKIALAEYGKKELEDIENIWHGLSIPYLELFNWLEGKSAKPLIKFSKMFHPMMLATPFEAEKEMERLNPVDFYAEWKWDGIRVQLVLDEQIKKLYSRSGDDISESFPDILGSVKGNVVLDGELLVGKDFQPWSFNNVQKRLNRKKPSRAILNDLPAFIKLYDILFEGGQDLRGLPLQERKKLLKTWIEKNTSPRLGWSEIWPLKNWEDLKQQKINGSAEFDHEGVMIKLKKSTYTAGRPKGPWFKWKKDPKFVDAILMYAQRGHGRRSSYYSDFTFGVWKEDETVPIGKAYFGFTDAELRKLDNWVRKNTIKRFGPVREVKRALVLEIAFDNVHTSPRHKSGIALRFPRIHRIRWDKPINEADKLESLLIN